MTHSPLPRIQNTSSPTIEASNAFVASHAISQFGHNREKCKAIYEAPNLILEVFLTARLVTLNGFPSRHYHAPPID